MAQHSMMAQEINLKECRIEKVVIGNGTEPGVPGHVTINISGGTHTHNYGQGPPQQEPPLDNSPTEQPEKPPAKTGKVVRSCQKRLSELRQRVFTFDGTQTPDAEFWQELYGLCEDLERDLDKVLK